MTAPKIIAQGWPVEYSGPLGSLVVESVPWSIDASIREGDAATQQREST